MGCGHTAGSDAPAATPTRSDQDRQSAAPATEDAEPRPSVLRRSRLDHRLIQLNEQNELLSSNNSHEYLFEPQKFR